MPATSVNERRHDAGRLGNYDAGAPSVGVNMLPG